MKRRLNRFIVVVVLLLLHGAVSVWSDTVMLYTAEAEGSHFFEIAGIDLAAAVEDGVLSVFFEEGYIIFNYGLAAPDPLEAPFATERVPVRVAKSGGASLLLEIRLSDPENDRMIPVSVTYVFTDIILDREISRGVVVTADIVDPRVTDARALCVEIGRAAALSALGG